MSALVTSALIGAGVGVVKGLYGFAKNRREKKQKFSTWRLVRAVLEGAVAGGVAGLVGAPLGTAGLIGGVSAGEAHKAWRFVRPHRVSL